MRYTRNDIMFDFILKKFVPFGLARTLSLAGIPLLQFAVMYFCSKEEAGKFYFISNAAFVGTQIADLGMSRAFPVLFGSESHPDHPQLPAIMLIRWLLGLLTGAIFIFCNSFGEVSWRWHEIGVIALFFCLGRVILLGNQGYRHSRQEFTLLLRGSAVHILASTGYLLLCAFYGRFSAEIAFVALTLGIWAELVTIDDTAAHCFNGAELNPMPAIRVAVPFATVGIAQAVYGRVETFVAGHFLSQGVLGIFGTLDSAFKMCIWPSYVSAQTVFPAINSAVKSHNQKELQKVAGRHFKLAGAICVIAMLAALSYWYVKLSGDATLTLAGAFLWLSIWMSIPTAFMIPLYYSMGLEKLLADSMLKLAIFRCLVAIALAFYFNFVGLCATHTLVTLVAIALLWWRVKPHLQNFLRPDAAESE